ncbi:alpha/beta hydrolase [uncultured Jannaschia sp.]|uniref:alpha/beta hydrolase n=1 Tax=uncultured Jannaschia sp. TaxID=293347 RepID=UPI00262F352D|nr:alpha/beta hydrolase [uncultured Jannaschia sp.]
MSFPALSMPMVRSCAPAIATLARASCVSFALISCGSHGEIGFLPATAPVGTVETVLVSTARQPINTLPLYTSARSDRPSFARFDISVPPQREFGTVTFPGRDELDPATDFLVASVDQLPDEGAFVNAINQTLAVDPSGSRKAILFVHGFNTNFAEGLYRQAQLQNDLARHGASVHFSWPSAARTRAYVADRESALFSRDALETTIAALGRSDATSFNLTAHSMGTFLLMDTLRLMARVGHDRVFDKIGAVVLISPDIEIDVFRKQAEPVLARGVPIYVLVSRGDRALRFSARLRGEQSRLGSIRSQTDLGGLDVAIIDLSSIHSEDMTGHFKAGTSPELIDFVRKLDAAGLDIFEAGKGPGVIGGSVAILQTGTGVVLEPLTGR